MANYLVLESRNGNLITTLPRRLSGCLIAILFVVLQSTSSSLYAADFKKIQIKGPRGSTEQFSGVTYGPIDSDDTLWRIADRYRQGKKYSIYQVMVAIQELNPDAFNSDNLNSMRNGATLQLPSDRFIARIDVGEARNKSEDDDSTWKVVKQSQPASRNIKPPEKLASQNDLTQTKTDIENKLNEIDAEQQRQFEVIRQQFAESIDSVQSLLDENRKIYERLDVVNEDIEDLRSRIGNEGEVQKQMDQILAMQSELLANSRREQEEASNFDLMKVLTSPAVLIGGTVLVSLSFLVGLAMWLLRRTRKEEPEVQEMEIPEENNSAMEEMDNLSDALSDELSGDRSDDDASDDLFGDDDLLDDVLAEELDDSLDEVLENELGAFDDLDDDILVSSDTGTDDDFEQAFGDDASEDALPDTEFDVFGGDDDDGIEITDSDDGLEDDLEGDLTADLDSEPEDIAEVIEEDASDNFDDFDIPSGIEENAPEEPEAKPGVYDPEGDLNLASSDVLSDEDMEKVGDKIGETTRQLNDITKELMKDLKDSPDKDPGDPDIAIEQPEPEEEEDDFEEFSGELTADFLSDVLSDSEPSADQEPSAGEEPSADQEPEPPAEPENEPEESPQEDLADELLAEFGIDATSEPEAPQNEQEDLADELLAEFGIDANEVSDTADADFDSETEQQEQASPQEDLADEILSEFGIDAEEEVRPEPSQQDDIADELLAEFGIDADEANELSEAPSEEKTEDQTDDESEANQAIDSGLADDLLAEFGIDSDDLAAGAESQSDDEEAQDIAEPMSDDASDNEPDESDNTGNEQADSLEQELLAELGMADDDIVSVDAESEQLDTQPDTPEPEDEAPREFAIDKMSEDDYQTLLSELDFDPPPPSPDDQAELSDHTASSSSTDETATEPSDELDDIDALLAQHAPDASADAEDDSAKKDDEPDNSDDIEALLAQHSPDNQASSDTATDAELEMEPEIELELDEPDAGFDSDVDVGSVLDSEETSKDNLSPETLDDATTDENNAQSGAVSAAADETYEPELDALGLDALELEGNDEDSLIDEIDLDDDSEEVPEDTSDNSVSTDGSNDASDTTARLSDELEPESADVDFDLEFDEEELGTNSSDIELADAGASDEEFKLELEPDNVDFELDIDDESDIPELAFENEVDIPTAQPDLEVEPEKEEPDSTGDILEAAADELAFELDENDDDPLSDLFSEEASSDLSSQDLSSQELAPQESVLEESAPQELSEDPQNQDASENDYTPEIPDELDAAADELMNEAMSDDVELEIDEAPESAEEPSAAELTPEPAVENNDDSLEDIAELVTDDLVEDDLAMSDFGLDDEASIPMTEPDTLSEMLSEESDDVTELAAASDVEQTTVADQPISEPEIEVDPAPIDSENEPFIDELEAAADALMGEDDDLDLPSLNDDINTNTHTDADISNDSDSNKDPNTDKFSIPDADPAQLAELEEALQDDFNADDGAVSSELSSEAVPSLQEQLQEQAEPTEQQSEPENVQEAQLVADDDDDYIDDAELDAALREFEEADLNSTLPEEESADKELAEPDVAATDVAPSAEVQAEPVVESSLLDSELEDVPGLDDWLGDTDTMSQSDVALPQDSAEPLDEWVGEDTKDAVGDAAADDLPSLDDLEFSFGEEDNNFNDEISDDISAEGADPELDAMLNSVEDELANGTDANDKFTSADLEGMDLSSDNAADSDGGLEEPDVLENISFDALLDSIEEPEEVEPQNIVSPGEATLDNPDLDLGALLDEDIVADTTTAEPEQPRETFTEVDDLLAESVEAETQADKEQDLNLDALLSEYSGVEGDADTLDVDLDSGNNAKLDLARAYIEINDTEAARELLSELKSEASADEQAEVDELLKKLD